METTSNIQNMIIEDTNDSTVFDTLHKMLSEDAKIEDVEKALDHILFANHPVSFWFSEGRKKRLIVNFMMNKRPPENKVDLSVFDFSFLN